MDQYFDLPMKITVGFCVLLLVGLAVAFYESSAEHSRLMEECLSDGHKEYECVGMLRTGRAK